MRDFFLPFFKVQLFLNHLLSPLSLLSLPFLCSQNGVLFTMGTMEFSMPHLYLQNKEVVWHKLLSGQDWCLSRRISGHKYGVSERQSVASASVCGRPLEGAVLRPTSALQCHPRASLSSQRAELCTGRNRSHLVGACLSGPGAPEITSDGYRHGWCGGLPARVGRWCWGTKKKRKAVSTHLPPRGYSLSILSLDSTTFPMD